MNKRQKLELAFRQHTKEVLGENAVKEFAGSELEALCVTFIQKQGQALPLVDVSGCYYAENGTVYRNDDDLNTIVCFLNRDTGGYMNLPNDVAEKIAEMLNNR